MHRIHSQYDAEVIAHAFQLLPPAIASRLESVHFLTGTDPLFAGLSSWEDTADGRSYRQVAHVMYPFHIGRPAAERQTTVVIPEWSWSWWQRPVAVIHEFGHVLHWQLGFDHDAVPVTRYAQANRREAFAEAFAAWTLPFGYSYGAAKDRLYDTDRATVALFDRLAG
jgi:hypothetical protein